MRARAGEIAVLDRIARAVDPRSLAVPEPDHPIDVRMPVLVEHLRAREARRRHLLVLSRHVLDAEAVERLARPLQCNVIAAERRARITGDVAPGAQARDRIAAHLLDRQTHEGLDAAQEDAPAR